MAFLTGLKDRVDDIKSQFDALSKTKVNDLIFGKPQNQGSQIGPQTSGESAIESIYSIENRKENWYLALPYGFKFTPRDGSPSITMYLPISPSNLQTSTQFATNIIPTMYGTIEEHSEVRYFDIVIQGTTGMVPKYIGPQGSLANNLTGRKSMPVIAGLDQAAGGFFRRTLGLAGKVVSDVDKLANGKKITSGVSLNQTGYVAFHNLYRLLLLYKRDAAGLDSQQARKSHPLQFLNYKDGIQYDVAVQRFSLVRDANNPMMYSYSIMLRAYNMRAVEGNVQADINLKEKLSNLGLEEKDIKSNSIFSNIKSISDQLKSVAGTALGGINILGR